MGTWSDHLGGGSYEVTFESPEQALRVLAEAADGVEGMWPGGCQLRLVAGDQVVAVYSSGWERDHVDISDPDMVGLIGTFPEVEVEVFHDRHWERALSLTPGPSWVAAGGWSHEGDGCGLYGDNLVHDLAEEYPDLAVLIGVIEKAAGSGVFTANGYLGGEFVENIVVFQGGKQITERDPDTADYWVAKLLSGGHRDLSEEEERVAVLLTALQPQFASRSEAARRGTLARVIGLFREEQVL